LSNHILEAVLSELLRAEINIPKTAQETAAALEYTLRTVKY